MKADDGAAGGRHEINVETHLGSASGAPDAGWVPAAKTYDPRTCTHRVRWSELELAYKLQFALLAAIAAYCAAASAAGFVWGLIDLERVLDDGSALAVAEAAAMLVGSCMMASGVVMTVRTWNRLHRPGGLTFWLACLGLVAPAFLLALQSAINEERYWTSLVLVPSLILAQVFVRFGAKLTRRSTCRTDPGLPWDVAHMLKRGQQAPPHPSPAPDTSETEGAGPEQEHCRHLVKFTDLKLGYLIFNLVVWVLYKAYLVFLGFAGLVLLLRMDELTGDSLDLSAGFLSMLGLVILNWICINEFYESGSHIHRTPLRDFIWAEAGYAATAAVLVWAGLRLDVHVLWVPAALAVFWCHQAWSARRGITDWSECRSDPELPPGIKAMLRNP
ncbi:hypothetical protein GCM10027447_08270 [Glycomyces halotolerans]